MKYLISLKNETLSLLMLPNESSGTLTVAHYAILYVRAYSATIKPTLGGSDGNVAYLLPTYQRLLEREKPVVNTVQVLERG